MSQYEFSLRQEVLLEKGAAVLGNLFQYKRQQQIVEETHPIAVMYSLVWAAKQDIVAVLPGNLDMLASLPCISRLSIWDRDLQQLFDSNLDAVLPSEVLTGYWEAPWTPEEIQCVHDDIDRLRERERRSQLGQGRLIDELVRRVEAVLSEAPLVWICCRCDPVRNHAGGISYAFSGRTIWCHLGIEKSLSLFSATQNLRGYMEIEGPR